MQEFCEKLSQFVNWYNAFRPHQSLDGATPLEIYFNETPAHHKPRYEPRKNWPTKSKCAAPQAKLKEPPGTKLQLSVTYFEGNKLLPIIALKKVA